MRSDLVCFAGKVVTGKNVSALERKCLQCHGEHHSLDKGSSVSTNTHITTHIVMYLFLTNTTTSPSIILPELHA